jgi:hypothetical protein
MSKKKFTDGINDIFAGPEAEETTMTFADEPTGNSQSARRQNSHKTFITNLDSLLAEINDDSYSAESGAEVVNRPGKSKSSNSGNIGTGYRAPVTGLDALIRQTLVGVEGEDEETTKRRISVIVDKMKLDRLKAIARMEGAFMKDIISDLIETYVHKYAKEKGVEL